MDARIRSRAAAFLFFAGATIGAISLVLPHPPSSDVAGLWTNVVLAYAGAGLVLWIGPKAPGWFFHVALAIGALIVTRAVWLSGEPVSFYAAWYIWIGLYVFYFFERLAAGLHVLFVASLYAGTLVLEPATSPVARWLTTITTLVVAGVFIDTLVRRARSQADAAADNADSMATIAEVAHELAALSDGEAARRALCSAAARVTGAESVVLWEPMPDGVGLRSVGVAGRPPTQTVLTFVGPKAGAGQAFTTGEPAESSGTVETIGLAPELLGAADVPKTCLWQPILREDIVIAVLAFYWDEPVVIDRPPLRTLVDLLSAESATTLGRVELVDRLATIARTDDLTGLPNRRAWNEEILREISRAGREKTPLCVAILDLDRFKAFNDEHGHQAGDRFLKQAAAAWSGELRATDILARYGGEEFALALPGIPPDEAAAVLERIRGATPGEQSCSAGVACWDGEEGSAELVGRADAALYEAKRAGRDQSVFA